MRKSYHIGATVLLSFLLSLTANAQNVTLSGSVKNNQTKEGVPAVSVTIKGSAAGTYTDDKGGFKITTASRLPLTLVISSIGFQTREVAVSSAAAAIEVGLEPVSTLGVEVVVSASRVPERILESPVSIERINLSAIRNAPASSYYDIFRNIKGVDITSSSLTFNTVVTRGFNGSGSPRVNQLIDGMDNQAPGLNFSVGNVIGLTELDVESMELLPGASSALYGPGGMNGTVLLNSKNPFKYKGLSYQIKTGLMHADKRQRPTPSPYYDWAVRWADNITPRLAFKMGAQLIQAKDWVANDESNYQVGDASRNDYGKVVPGTRATDPNYDGVNVYGDETSVDLRQFLQGVIATNPAQLTPILGQFLSKPMPVSRTGYKESEVVNPNTVNFKLNGALHYKLTDKLEASFTAYWGTGNTVYTGSDRYSFKELRMGQYKLELKHQNWFLRAYTTQENAGEAYNATIATRIFNEAWKPSYNPANVNGSWYIQYAGAFAQNAAGIFTNVLTSGGSFAQAQASVGAALSNLHTTGRLIADAGRPVAGSTAFKTLFDNVRLTPIKKGGGLLLDASDLYQYEGQYNFSHLTGKAFDLIAGASFKRYRINSQGTIFADSSGPINIDEVGAYAQVSRSLFNDYVKLSASGRYDKNTNFSGRFTPRFTMVIKLAENHNLRASYQTAYRFPTTQNQWINLQVGSGTVLLGGLPSLRKFYNFRTINQLYDNPNGGLPAYTLESVRAGGALLAQGNVPGALKALQEAEFGDYKPETMKSFEVGYKGLFNNKFLVDMYAYFGRYENFLGRQIVVQSLSASPTAPFLGPNRILSIAVNSKDNVRTYGYGVSFDWLLGHNYVLTANTSLDRIKDVPVGFVSFFNTPTYRVNFGFSNTGMGYQKRIGFSAMMRNQDGFFYESDFRQGAIPGYTVIDAQVSYKFPKIRSLIKLGANNLTNKYYRTAFGNPAIGGLYYVSYGYNVF